MDARNRFLNEAMSLYAISSPQLSAHLGFERIQLSEQSATETKRNKGTPQCRACGTPAIAGWTRQKTLRPEGKRSRDENRSRASGRKQSPLVAGDSCLVCHRTVKSPVARKPRPPKIESSSDGARRGSEATKSRIAHAVRTKKTPHAKSLLARMRMDEEERRAPASQSFSLSDFFRT